jgi:predicted ATPase
MKLLQNQVLYSAKRAEEDEQEEDEQEPWEKNLDAERRDHLLGLAKRAEEALGLAKRAEEAEKRAEEAEKRAEEAEQALEAMKVECTLLRSLITQFLQDPLNETTETTAGGPPKKRARNEQPERVATRTDP